MWYIEGERKEKYCLKDSDHTRVAMDSLLKLVPVTPITKVYDWKLFNATS